MLLEMNDTCVVERTNSNGICKFVENCPSVLKEVQQKAQFPTLCGFQRNKEIICCPEELPAAVAKEMTRISTQSM